MATYEHIGVDAVRHGRHDRVRRGPNNFVDTDMVGEIADVLEGYDRTPEVRAIVLCAEGKHFCAGADFGSRGADGVNAGHRSVAGIYIRRRSGCGAPASRSSRRCMARRWVPASAWR